MKRRQIFAGGMACGATSIPAIQLLLSRALATEAPPPPVLLPSPALHPFAALADRITDIKVCLRPFRAAGPRLDVEKIADRTIFHNYGHGGSGWSLSWGSANLVVSKAATLGERRIAVIGCGIIGLTSALTAQRAGMDVTIYTKDLLPHTRSVRANGSWTPDSRIALTQQAGPAFAPLWEQMARYSWATYRTYLGLPANPIEFIDEYWLYDTPHRPEETPLDPSKPTFATTGRPQQNAEFAHYEEHIADITPQQQNIPSSQCPFGVSSARVVPRMIYNFGAFGHLLLSEFFQAGGRIVMKELHTPADFGSIPEKVIINCPGYAARDWMKDDTLIPVRGQTAWLPPDMEHRYGLYYRGASMLSKSDGVMIQAVNLEHQGEVGSVGNSFEHPDRAESERAIKIFADLFTHSSKMGG